MKVDDDTQKALLLFNRRAEAAEAAKPELTSDELPL